MNSTTPVRSPRPWVGLPSPDLVDRVEAFWAVSTAGRAGSGFREFFPDAAANLIFRFDDRASRLVLLGPITAKAAVELKGDATYFGVRFRLGQLPALGDAEPAELVDRSAEVARLGGERLDAIAGRLRELQDFAARQRRMEELLRGLPPLVRDERVRAASRFLETCRGRLRVEDLADRLGLHVRSLERLFLANLGVSPKRLSRLVRLGHVLRRLEARDFPTLADLAADCGYADQSHLHRELQGMIGRRPGDREAFRPRILAAEPATRVVGRVRG